ncbi:MAG: UDP-N-acetylmuramate dehydrogenase [Clostridia bacterium]|nr:UDP-N-acetylmuramate dehydrogenase [Clostridia bacterium]
MGIFARQQYFGLLSSASDVPALRRNVPLAELCTMHVGGLADAVCTPASKEALCRCLLIARHKQIPYALFGGGSNIIPGDGFFPGVIFSTAALRGVQISGTKIKADCGCRLGDLVLAAARAGLGGLECLYGIPGTVGGGVKMNAGAHGSDIASCLEAATMFSTVTGEKRVFSKNELAFSYRMSLLQKTKEWILLDATFACTPTETQRIRARIAEVTKKRREAQPLSLPSAGSVFRRPKEGEVWRMIDMCDLRGYTIGGAQISKQHAGFIVNVGGATARDVHRLVCLVQERVLGTLGISLVPEIEFLDVKEEETCRLQRP